MALRIFYVADPRIVHDAHEFVSEALGDLTPSEFEQCDQCGAPFVNTIHNKDIFSQSEDDEEMFDPKEGPKQFRAQDAVPRWLRGEADERQDFKRTGPDSRDEMFLGALIDHNRRPVPAAPDMRPEEHSTLLRIIEQEDAARSVRLTERREQRITKFFTKVDAQAWVIAFYKRHGYSGDALTVRVKRSLEIHDKILGLR